MMIGAEPVAELQSEVSGATGGFGASVAAGESTLAVASWLLPEFSESAPAYGVSSNVQVFSRESDGKWNFSASLETTFTGGASWTKGLALAASDNWIAVGGGSDYSESTHGRVELFARENATWRLAQTLEASDGVRGDGFGAALAFSGSTLVVGAPQQDRLAGVVYVFQLDGEFWTLAQRLDTHDLGPLGTIDWTFFSFGTAVAIDADILVVSLPASHADTPLGESSFRPGGVVAAYRRANETWRPQQLLEPDTSARKGAGGSYYGSSLALLDDVMAVGYLSTGSDNEDGGAVFMYTEQGSAWRRTQILRAPGTNEPDGFGASIVFSEGRLVVGAPGDNRECKPGAVYVFTTGHPGNDALGGRPWTLANKFEPDGGQGDTAALSEPVGSGFRSPVRVAWALNHYITASAGDVFVGHPLHAVDGQPAAGTVLQYR